MNQYDEIKKLLENSRSLLGKQNLVESRKDLIKLGLINEQLADDPVNVDADIEGEIDIETTPQEDKYQKYFLAISTFSILQAKSLLLRATIYLAKACSHSKCTLKHSIKCITCTKHIIPKPKKLNR